MACDIFFTVNAENNIIPMKIARALPKEGGSSPITTIISATNEANITPIPAPVTKVCFQFIALTVQSR
jgi:hypothetical protein